MNSLPQSIALVHEWFTPRSSGGSEQVVQQIDRLLEAGGSRPDLFALVDGESRRRDSWLEGRDIHTSFIQRLPWGASHVQQYLPLLPLAIEQFDLSGYPLVLSSNHLVAKGVLTGPDQLHLSYVHTPVRYAWDQMHPYLKHSALAQNPLLGPLIRWQLHQLRQWDRVSSASVDVLAANSRFTAARIRRCWRRTAHVIHPPVNVSRFRCDRARGDAYVSVCRLVPNKRVDLVVEAFNRIGLPLVVIGDGPERARLQAMAHPNVRLLGHCRAAEMADWLATCRAFVYAGVEDFGIAPVEAMAAGAPVIAYRAGGLLDTVRCWNAGDPRPTGLLFPEQTAASLVEALRHFESGRLWRNLAPDSLRDWAETFAPDRFEQSLGSLLERSWERHTRRLASRGLCL
ncbi:MAG: glycosyltransferase [Cyanobacteriota bacterium]|nr:glycosyltransferase [Cyanobacteriota bacterium]